MKKIAVIGHFSLKNNGACGQTIKTRIVTNELQRVYGDSEVTIADTSGDMKSPIRIPFTLIGLLRRHRNIVIMPAHKGLTVIAPLLAIFNIAFRRSIHYVIIGGWLPDLMKVIPWLRWSIKHFDGIYPETNYTANQLKAMLPHDRIHVMPNCKQLNILQPEELYRHSGGPFPLCTFSRINKEKGIEEAVNAVNACNREMGTTVFTLDIYGQVESKDEPWFHELMSHQDANIQFKGLIPFDQTTQTLRHYHALLFPTYYPGECFAGTLIDALAAGLPVIASDWHSNPEVVIPQQTGIIIPAKNQEALTQALIHLAKHPDSLDSMRPICLTKARDYLSDRVLSTLTNRLQE